MNFAAAAVSTGARLMSNRGKGACGASVDRDSMMTNVIKNSQRVRSRQLDV